MADVLRIWLRPGQQLEVIYPTTDESEPAPVRLSAEMLGDEDRNAIMRMRENTQHRLNRMSSDCMCEFCEGDREAIAWADRLLDNHGEG